MTRNRIPKTIALLAGVMLAGSAAAAEQTDAGTADMAALDKAHPARPIYSPYAGRNFPKRPLFGDTRLHTSFSMDAGAFGARLDPNDAYRFARGEELVSSTGQPVKLSRALDFLVVSDHSDGMGFFPMLFAGEPQIMADAQGSKWHEMIRSGQGAAAALDIIFSFSTGTMSPAILPLPGTPAYRGAWRKTIEAAEQYNEPGRFTAFIGYEWTSNTAGNNLHRNVIYRDGADKAAQVEPFTTGKPAGSDNPRDLWKRMESYEHKTGGDVLAIAHNGNLSNGRMFPVIESFTGKPVDRRYADQRQKWERLYEATQTKGDGEAHWTNTIGDPELITAWTDPDFDPAEGAFYHARVLEVPTPRRTAYDAKRFGITPPAGVTMTLQERANTSPIWYTPG